MSLFKELIKASGNSYAGVVEDGIEAGDITGFIDSGSYSLNAVMSGSIYGGYPMGKVTGLAGDPAAGKSFAALTAVKLFLDANPSGFCMYFESESAISKDMIESRGIDSKRIAIVPVVTVQEFRTSAIKILDKYIESDKKRENRPPMMFVLDSLGMLSTTKEIEDTAEGSETKDMTRSQIIKAAFRVLTLKLGRANVTMLVTTHTFASMDQYSPKAIGGGSGFKFACSTILMLNKRKSKEGDDAKEITGNNIRVVAEKSRLTKEFSQVECLINYSTGLDRYRGLLDIAEQTGVIVKEGVRYKLADGRLVYGKAINQTPETVFTKEILDKIDVECKTLFGYGAVMDATEETLDECIDEDTGEIISKDKK
jgi:RecA/RadA recombinase